MNKLTSAALGLAIIGFASTYASAQNVTVSPTDLVLGFQVTDASGTGSSSDLEVDLGSSSLFTTTSTFSLTGSTGLTSADLSATYGSNWATRGDLTWGVAGISSTTSNSFYATDSSSSASNASSLAVPYGQIGGLVGGVGNGVQTANSSKATVVGNSTSPASSIGNSFTSEITDQGALTGDYNYFNPNGSSEVNAGSGSTLGSIDLYSFNEVGGKGAKPATELGVFSLTDTNGILGFTYTGINAVATPEPSAYALGLCALVIFFVLKRRQKVA